MNNIYIYVTNDFKNNNIISQINNIINEYNITQLGKFIYDYEWIVDIIKCRDEKEKIYLEINIYKYKLGKKSKNKYCKHNFNYNKKANKIKSIGIKRCQYIHAQDTVKFLYVPLNEFLKDNKVFDNVLLYQKCFDGNYRTLRHKNLFSEYKDEISDFQRYTFISKNEVIKITHKDDENILDYDNKYVDLSMRKFSREFAKYIFHNNLGFKDSELISFLKNHEVYVKVEVTIFKESKEVWDKISVKDMNNKMLTDELKKQYSKKKRSRDKHYHTKKQLKRKVRYQKYDKEY